MAAYAEVSVVVDGGLEECVTFHDETAMLDYIAEVGDDAADHGYPTEVYVLWHEHDETGECECVQYLTDHHPYASWNTDDAPALVDVHVAWETGDDTRVTWWPGSSTLHVETRYGAGSAWTEADVFTHYGDAHGTPPTLEQAAEAACAYLTRTGR